MLKLDGGRVRPQALKAPNPSCRGEDEISFLSKAVLAEAFNVSCDEPSAFLKGGRGSYVDMIRKGVT